MTSTRRPLPMIAPCPCGKNHGKLATFRGGVSFVKGYCGWRSRVCRTQRGAILAWNRRASDAEAERRGALAAAQWIWDSWENYSMGLMSGEEIVKQLREAIERGEVLPAKGKRA